MDHPLCSERDVQAKLARAAAAYQVHIAASATRVIVYQIKPARLSFTEAIQLHRVTRVFKAVEIEPVPDGPLCRRAPFSNPL